MNRYLESSQDQRAVPIETVFRSNGSNSWRDPLKPNRIHFRFPDSWTNSIGKDSIIGIRDMFITHGFRRATLTLSVSFMMNDGITTTKVKSREITCSKFFDDSVVLKDYIIKINDQLMELESDFNSEIEKGVYEDINKCLRTRKAFVYLEYKNHQNRFVITSPFNDLAPDERSTIGSYQYYVDIKVVDYNEDAKIILNLDKLVETDNGYYSTDVWDRNSCILNSNLSYTSDESYLGHTRKYALPKLKYYNLTSSNKSFWIDLYATCCHDAPVILPRDGKDELFIEAQLLSSAKAVL